MFEIETINAKNINTMMKITKLMTSDAKATYQRSRSRSRRQSVKERDREAHNVTGLFQTLQYKNSTINNVMN